MRILITIFLLVLPLLCSAGQVYKWRDKYGNIHYSDVEPANQNTQRKDVKTTIPKETAPVVLTDKQIACERARNNLKALAESETVQMDLDNDGKAELLTDAQRAQQTTAMEAAVTANCSR